MRFNNTMWLWIGLKWVQWLIHYPEVSAKAQVWPNDYGLMEPGNIVLLPFSIPHHISSPSTYILCLPYHTIPYHFPWTIQFRIMSPLNFHSLSMWWMCGIGNSDICQCRAMIWFVLQFRTKANDLSCQLIRPSIDLIIIIIIIIILIPRIPYIHRCPVVCGAKHKALSCLNVSACAANDNRRIN